MFSGSSRLSGSSHSAMDDSDRRMGFLSWMNSRGLAASLVRVEKESSHLVGSLDFLDGSNLQA